MIAAGLIAAALAAAPEPARANAWTKPHELRIAIADNPKNLNAMTSVSQAQLSIERLLFDVLVSYDTHLHRRVSQLAVRIPSLANGDISADGKRITYHLRHNVRWHDGAPFTSDDVRFTFDAIMSPHNTVLWRAGYDKVTRLETPDPFTVIFHFAKPYPPAIDALFADGPWPYGILPAHILRGEQTLDTSTFFTDHPIGTGPFKLVKWERSDRIEFAPNPDYYLGRPKLAKITVRLVPDAQTRVLLAQTHEIDWYYEAPPTTVAQLARLDGFTRVDTEQNRFTAIAFNLNHAPVRDLNVRTAIATAIDRRRIVAVATFGTAIPARTDLPPVVWKPPANFGTIPYDPKRAAAQLDAAGWRMGAGGVRERGGTPLRLNFAIFSASPEASAIGLSIQAQLAAIGVAVDLRPVPRSVYYLPAADGGVLNKGDFDLAISTWASGLDPDNEAVYGCAYRPPNGFNWARYCEPAMESAQSAALSTFDEARRYAAYETIERLALRDIPQFILYWPLDVQFVNRDFRNFNPNLVCETYAAYRWDI